jgi:hypothetical protein
VAVAICLETVVLAVLLGHPWLERMTAARMGLRLSPGARKRPAAAFSDPAREMASNKRTSSQRRFMWFALSQSSVAISLVFSVRRKP